MGPWAQVPVPGARGRAPGRGKPGLRSQGNFQEKQKPKKGTPCRQLGVVLDVCPSTSSPPLAARGSVRCWAVLKSSTSKVKMEVGERLCLEAIISYSLNLVDTAIFINVCV